MRSIGKAGSNVQMIEKKVVPRLRGVGGVEPRAYGHMAICLNLGKTCSELLRGVLNQLTEQE